MTATRMMIALRFVSAHVAGSNPAQTIVYSAAVTAPQIMVLAVAEFSQYKAPYESTRSFSIWQPPKA